MSETKAQFDYQFAVSKDSEVDIARILEESKDHEALLISTKGSDALLALRADFLAKFVEHPNVVVNGESLHPRWGSNGTKVSSSGRYLNLYTSIEGSQNTFRFGSVEPSNIPRVKKQLAEARYILTHKKKVTVRVL